MLEIVACLTKMQFERSSRGFSGTQSWRRSWMVSRKCNLSEAFVDSVGHRRVGDRCVSDENAG